MRRTWRAKRTKRSVSTALCMGTMSAELCGLRFRGIFRSFPKTSMHLENRFVAILRDIVNNLQLKCGIECSLLLCSGHSQLFAPCLRTCSCRHRTLGHIMNVIKCGVYLRAATILLRAWSGVASINVVWRLFKQIRYLFWGTILGGCKFFMPVHLSLAIM